MRFKTPGVEGEFLMAEPKIISVLLYCDWYALRNFGHEVLVTDISRSQEEYDRIYAEAIDRGISWADGKGIKHYAGPMPHLEDARRGLKCRAGDLGMMRPGLDGAFRLSEVAAKELRDNVNAHWPRRDGKRTAIVHDVGSGAHVHLQAEIT